MSISTPSTTPGAAGDNSVPKIFEVTYEKALEFGSKLITAYKNQKSPELQSDEWMESQFIEFKKRNDFYEKKLAARLNNVFKQQEKYVLKKPARSG